MNSHPPIQSHEIELSRTTKLYLWRHGSNAARPNTIAPAVIPLTTPSPPRMRSDPVVVPIAGPTSSMASDEACRAVIPSTSSEDDAGPPPSLGHARQHRELGALPQSRTSAPWARCPPSTTRGKAGGSYSLGHVGQCQRLLLPRLVRH